LTGPVKGLIKEGEFIGVALKEGRLKSIRIVVCDMPEGVAEAPVEGPRETLAREFVRDELNQGVGEFRLVLGAVALGRDESRSLEGQIGQGANDR
jgi:hypothetical protein